MHETVHAVSHCFCSDSNQRSILQGSYKQNVPLCNPNNPGKDLAAPPRRAADPRHLLAGTAIKLRLRLQFMHVDEGLGTQTDRRKVRGQL